MRVSRNRTISINGSILDVDVTHDEFLQEFVEWVDSKGWSFMGMTDEITPEEASQNLIDSLIDEKDKKRVIPSYFLLYIYVPNRKSVI